MLHFSFVLSAKNISNVKLPVSFNVEDLKASTQLLIIVDSSSSTCLKMSDICFQLKAEKCLKLRGLWRCKSLSRVLLVLCQHFARTLVLNLESQTHFSAITAKPIPKLESAPVCRSSLICCYSTNRPNRRIPTSYTYMNRQTMQDNFNTTTVATNMLFFFWGGGGEGATKAT